MSKKGTPPRPRDTNELAVMIGRIATGEQTEPDVPQTAPGARQRGEARAAKLTPAERKKIARKAAKARWNVKRRD